MALHYAALTETSAQIARGALSASELAEAHLARIEALDGGLGAYAHVTATRARARAAALDAERARGDFRGPLHGATIGVKDLCDTPWAPTTAGMKIFRGRIPERTATLVERLERAGAVVLGKLKMTEGAYTSHHPEDPAPLNPWGADRWVGSSSTGSGVATSAGLCQGSIGSDTGGSIRFPSATCGLTGMKPTWGRVSRAGVFPLADSLDHLGPMTRSAADAAAMLGAMAGADPRDPTALTDPVPDYLAALSGECRGLTVGIDRAYAAADPEVAAALEAALGLLADLGARVKEVSFPPFERLVELWIPMCAVETAHAHRATYPARKADYGPALAQLIEEGRATAGTTIAEATTRRLDFCGALRAMFRDCDMLLVPAMPVKVPTLAEMADYGAEPQRLLDILRFTAPFDFSGSPALTFPAGFDSAGLPIALQLVGPHLSEAALFRAADAFQRVTDWHARRPPGFA